MIKTSPLIPLRVRCLTARHFPQGCSPIFLGPHGGRVGGRHLCVSPQSILGYKAGESLKGSERPGKGQSTEKGQPATRARRGAAGSRGRCRRSWGLGTTSPCPVLQTSELRRPRPGLDHSQSAGFSSSALRLPWARLTQFKVLVGVVPIELQEAVTGASGPLAARRLVLRSPASSECRDCICC